jgi:ankyrin repeat protein
MLHVEGEECPACGWFLPYTSISSASSIVSLSSDEDHNKVRNTPHRHSISDLVLLEASSSPNVYDYAEYYPLVLHTSMFLDPMIYELPLSSGLGRLVRMSNNGYSLNHPGTSSVLQLLDTNLFSFVRSILERINPAISKDLQFELQLYLSPETSAVLCMQSLDVQLVGFLVALMVNHGLLLDLVTRPQRPVGGLMMHIVQHLHSLHRPSLIRFLDTLPSVPRRATEESLLYSAIELGNTDTVEFFLDRGTDPDLVVYRVCGIRVSAMERSAQLGHVDIIRCLLARGGHPNVTFHMVPWVAGLSQHDPTTATLPDSAIEIMEILLEAGGTWWDIDPSSYACYRDPRVVCTILRRLFGPNSNECMRRALWHTLLEVCVDDSVLVTMWSFVRENHHLEDLQHWGRFFSCPAARSLDVAIRTGDTALFQYLIDFGAQPTAENLTTAVACHNNEAVEQILEREISPFWDGGRPIALAHESGNDRALHLFRRRALDSPKARHHEVLEKEAGETFVVNDEHSIQELLSHCQRISISTASSHTFRNGLAQALTKAIEMERLDLVERLVQQGACPDLETLRHAIGKRNTDITQFLMKDMDSVDEFDGLLLHDAVEWGNCDLIESLILAGYPMDRFYSSTAIAPFPKHGAVTLSLAAIAIIKEDKEVYRLLLQRGAPIDNRAALSLKPDQRAEKRLRGTAIFAAVYRSDTVLLQYLLNRGGDPWDELAILYASMKHDTVAVQMLLGTFRNRYNGKRRGFGGLALQDAIRRNDVKMVAMLAELADGEMLVDSATSNIQISPLGEAIATTSNESLEMVWLLLQDGASPNSVVKADREWKSNALAWRITALMEAITTYDLTKVTELISAGARLEPCLHRSFRYSPLQFAVKTGAKKIVQYLLRKGADPNDPPAAANGFTAFQIAARQGFLGIAADLVMAGADVHASPGRVDGKTALDVAAEQGRIDLLLFLAHSDAGLGGEQGKLYGRAIRLATSNGCFAAKELLEGLRAAAVNRGQDHMNRGGCPAPSTNACPQE